MANDAGGNGTGVGGAGTAGTWQYGAGSGGASLQGGAGDVSPTKTPVEYRDVAVASWEAIVLYSQAT